MKSIIINPNSFDGESFASEYSINSASFWVENGNILIYPDNLPDIPNLIVNLSLLKSRRNKAIDLNTEYLILQGFIFDNENFSLSSNAQLNWIRFKTLQALMTWPVAITTISDGEYELAEVNLNSFLSASGAAIQSHLDSGRALKVSINAAIDVAGVDAIVDRRQ